MARILITWELGSGYGHLLKLRPLARALAAAGHEVAFAVKDIEKARALLAADGIALHPAPAVAGKRPRLPLAASYGEVLMRVGWLDPSALAERVAGWQRLFAALQPEIVVFNHSPSALLAARGAPVRRVLYGHGFECPEPRADTPVFGPWVPTPRPRLEAGEQRLLETINAALAARRLPAMSSLAELVECEQRILATYPELDPYAAQRPGATYPGPIADSSGLAPLAWEPPGGQRVFVYLNERSPHPDALLAGLASAGAAALVHVPGRIGAALRQRWAGPGMHFSEQPVDLGALGASLDLAVCNGGHGTLTEFLEAGCPQLLVPSHVEQWIHTRLAQQRGLAAAVEPGAEPAALERAVADALADEGIRAGAAAFARRYGGVSAAARVAATLALVVDET